MASGGYVQKYHTSRVLSPEDKGELLKKQKGSKRSAKVSKAPEVVHEWLWRIVPTAKESSSSLQTPRDVQS